MCVGDVPNITARLDTARIAVTLPRAIASRWAGSNEISLHGEQQTDGGVLRILVEKDFTCVEPREGEDQRDLYPNPKSASAKASDD